MNLRLAFLCALTFAFTSGAETPPSGGPTIQHAPVAQIPRGLPVHVVATVTAGPGHTLLAVRTMVRLADAGTPIPVSMAGGPGDGAYQTDIALSMIQGVQRFWYHIEARDQLGRISTTPWYPVRVIEVAEPEASKAAPKTVFTAKNAWIGTGLLAVGGGATAILEHQNDQGDSDENTPAPSPAPLTREEKKPKKDPVSPPPPCLSNASAVVTFDPNTLSPSDPNPLTFYVCGACRGATIRVDASWLNTDVVLNNYVNDTCSPEIAIAVDKPSITITSGSINIYADDTPIFTSPWPMTSIVGRP